MQDVKWDVPKEGVNTYMEVIVKDTLTLHKVLSRYLSGSVVEVRIIIYDAVHVRGYSMEYHSS